MSTSKAVLALSLVCLAGPARAGVVGRAFLALRNAPAKLGQKLELMSLAWKAKNGQLRENQLLKLKTRSFHTADGGTRRERVLVTVEDGKIFREATVYRTRGTHGERGGSGRNYDGNSRRVSTKIGETIAAALADPDFKAASHDPAAKARYDARQAERQRAFEQPPTGPHRFVDAAGRPVTLKKVGAVE